MPAISVVMSVYNGEKFLKESVESILNQTFTDFEFLITDDCSTDNTLNILQEYASKDSRIRLMSNSENIGLTKSLNRMIDVSCGDFVARIDADDVSYEQRFQKQIEFMRSHPEIGVCGTNIGVMCGNVKKSNTCHFFDHDEIQASMLFNNAMPHTSIMIRGELLREQGYRYDEEFKIMQDYEFWQRLIKHTQFHVLKEELAIFRILDGGVTGQSSKKANYREDFLKCIFRSGLSNLGIIPSDTEINTHIIVADIKMNYSLETMISCEEWLLKLLDKNNEICSYDNEALRKIIHNCWYNVCSRSSSIGLRVFNQYLKSRLLNYNNINIRAALKLFVKCLKKYDSEFDCHNDSNNHTAQ